jgi:hypothetical protein
MLLCAAVFMPAYLEASVAMQYGSPFAQADSLDCFAPGALCTTAVTLEYAESHLIIPSFARLTHAIIASPHSSKRMSANQLWVVDLPHRSVLELNGLRILPAYSAIAASSFAPT